MAAKKKVDYEAIEPGWRAGLKSPEQLANEYTEETGVSVSRNAIIKHFKKMGVPRDLSAKVRAKADAMVAEAMVTGKVSTETTIEQKTIIDAAALDVATIRVSHRKDISRFRNLALNLLAELEAETSNPELFEELGIILRAEDDKGQDKRNDLYHKVISGSSRIDSAKKLAETLKTLIALEREAYGIDSDAGGGGDMNKVDVSDTERARRIAFALRRGVEAAKQGGE